MLRARRNPTTGEGVQPAPPVLMGRHRRAEGTGVDPGCASVPDITTGRKAEEALRILKAIITLEEQHSSE